MKLFSIISRPVCGYGLIARFWLELSTYCQDKYLVVGAKLAWHNWAYHCWWLPHVWAIIEDTQCVSKGEGLAQTIFSIHGLTGSANCGEGGHELWPGAVDNQRSECSTDRRAHHRGINCRSSEAQPNKVGHIWLMLSGNGCCWRATSPELHSSVQWRRESGISKWFLC